MQSDGLNSPLSPVVCAEYKHTIIIIGLMPGGRFLMPLWLASLASNHRLSPLWVRVPLVSILRTCPNMTLAVEWDVKAQL